MGIVIRQGVKTSIVSYAGALLGYVIWLYFMPKWLQPEEIGLLKVIFDAVILIVPFLHAGSLNIIIKYYPYFNSNREKESKFLGYVIGLPLVASIVFFTLFFIFRGHIQAAYIEESPLFVEYIYYLLPLAFISVYIQVIEFLIKARLRITIPRLIREIFVRLFNLTAIGLYFFNVISLTGLVQSLVVINLIHMGLLFIYYRHLRGEVIKPSRGIARTRYFKPLLNYTMFMFMGLGGGALVSRLDTIMTSSILGLEETGIYGIAFLIAQVIELPKRSFNSIISPLVARAFKSKERKAIENYYHRSSLNLSIISIILFTGLWSNLQLVYNFVPNKDLFLTGSGVVMFIGLSKVLDMSMGVNNEIMQNSPFYKWSVYLSVGVSLVAIGTNLIFIPMMGITGAALATFISVFLYNFFRFIVLWWKMDLNPFTLNNLWVLLFGLLCFGITEMVYISNIYVDLPVNGLIIFVSFILPIYFFRLSPDFNSFVQNTAARVGIRLKH